MAPGSRHLPGEYLTLAARTGALSSGLRLQLRLSGLKLVLGQHARVAKAGEPVDLGGRRRLTGRHAHRGVLAELLVLRDRRLLLALGDVAAADEQVDEYPEPGHEDDEQRPQRLGPTGQIT